MARRDDRLTTGVAEMRRAASRLIERLRARATAGLPQPLEEVVRLLRTGAASLAAAVEDYARRLRLALEPAPARRPRRRVQRRRPAALSQQPARAS